MYWFRSKRNELATLRYATCADFCEILAKDLQSLYLLVFLLTGSCNDAEQCCVATIETCVGTNSVFEGWERSWSKRCLIINAIQRVFSRPTGTGWKPEARCEIDVESRGCSAINTVARLDPALQRFVFAMSVLERYSVRECALLLGCTPRNVVEARSQALKQLAGFNPLFTRTAERQT
jgi:hypothetical protein